MNEMIISIIMWVALGIVGLLFLAGIRIVRPTHRLLIETLGNLTNLRVIDISGNEIDDLTALYELGKLEYLNVIGNNIPNEQIETLKEKEILVMY